MNVISVNAGQVPLAPIRTAQHGRLHGPDVLRGFAALGVVFFHVFYLSGAPKLPIVAFFVGRMDFFVRLFFALSAFAIAYAYSARLNGTNELRGFYIKRYFRLAPLFYFVIVCGAALTLWQGRPLASPFDYLLSLSFSFSLVPGRHGSLVGGGWSLGLEWLFYIAFPFLFSFASNLRAAAALWVVAEIIAIASVRYFSPGSENPLLHEYSLLYFLAHLPFFVVGIACFHGLMRYNRSGRRMSPALIGGLVPAVFVLTLVYFAMHWSDRVPEELFLSIVSFSLVMLGALGLPVWLDNRVTRYLGKISYSLYLMQFVVFGFFEHLGVFVWICGLQWDPLLIFLLCASVTTVTVIAVSALTYAFVELPGMRLADIGMNYLTRVFKSDVPSMNPAVGAKEVTHE